MNWIILLVLIGVFVLIQKVRHFRHRFSLTAITLIIIFVYVTFSYALGGEEINWKSAEGIGKGIKIYFSWLAGSFDNVRTITANAVKMDWSKNNTQEIKVLEEK